jgi:phage tail sheath protein FI
VYLQEVPSGAHTIVGVPTSVTAFLGRTAWGPTDQAVTVSSFDEFTTQFGGLLPDSPVTYAVQDFFLNGGTTAIILRLFKPPAAASLAASTGPQPLMGTATIPADTAHAPVVTLDHLFAASPGAWGQQLTYTATQPTPAKPGAQPYSAAVIARYTTDTWTPVQAPVSGNDQDVLFDLTITRQLPGGQAQKVVETYACVAKNPKAGARYVGRVLELSSSLAQYDPDAKPGTKGDGVDSAFLTASDAGPGGVYDTALAFLDKHVDIYNLVVIPPDQHDGDLPVAVTTDALARCHARKATLIVDPPTTWTAKNVMDLEPDHFNDDLGISVGDEASRFAAIYYPRVVRSDPYLGGGTRTFVASGIIAGVIARTDATRGVWKAPAGFAAGLSGIVGLEDKVDDATSGHLNGIGVNCLRSFSASGPVVWGARTARGSDILADDYKYLPIRRLADYIEQTLLRSTMWAVYEPNDEPLWAQLRLGIGAFMDDLFRQGAFQGSSRDKAYFVKCDATTTLQSDIDSGIVNVQIGFAPLKPAEFVILYLQQIAGQATS